MNRKTKSTASIYNISLTNQPRPQSTPVGSLQTGHEVIISPNKDRHNVTAKVKYSNLSLTIFVRNFFVI